MKQLIPLDIPAGVHNHGTEYQSKGRWREASLVRWENNEMRPIGGWQEYADTLIGKAPRAMIAWQDNSADPYIALATYEKLYHVSTDGITTDITPVGFAAGFEDAQENLGYGGKAYGADAYGTAREPNGIVVEATTWALDTWGEYLVGCSIDDGKLYEWQLDTLTAAAAISGAPTGCVGLVVTDERFLFALGAGSNPRKVQWCDREDNTTWTPAVTNEAGDIELQTSGEIQFGLRVRGRTLIVTNTDAHVANYIAPPLVYGFEQVSSSCGAASRRAGVAVEQGAFWMGQYGFFHYDGSTVRQIPCEVSDLVFKGMNRSQISKVQAVRNGQFSEVWWFYCSEESTEIDSYVALDYRENHWMTGKIDRTCGVDLGVFNKPLWCDSAGVIYRHESGIVHGVSVPYAETGPIELGNGDRTMTVTNVYTDEQALADAQLTFKTRYYPNGDETEHGPYAPANPMNVRFSGREVRMRVEQVAAGDWRVGTMRLDAVAGSKR